ncbi:hypothetical protein FQN57_001172 [Myotisia sp. PD_48]|nr:hypothetical protein FQN57_001172 [Myotisia sp. PD_48]
MISREGKRDWILLLTISLVLLYFTLLAVYRLTLHPLAKYPGPFWSKVSSWPGFFQVFSGSRHLEAWRQHETYGPIVRIAPDTLAFNTVSSIKGLFGPRKLNVQKSDWYRTLHAAHGGHSVHSEVNREKHAFRRRVIEHAFSESALKSAEPFITENVRTWCKHLGTDTEPDGWTAPKNMDDWSNYLSYDIMGDLTFGKRFNCMESDEHRYVPVLMLSSSNFLYTIGHLPFIRFIRPFLRSGLTKLIAGKSAESQTKFSDYARQQMALRLQAVASDMIKDSRKDLTHYLFNARDPQTGRGFDWGDLGAESALLISAGSDTTAVALSATIFYLLHYPMTLIKAEAEVRSAFVSVDEIRGKGRLNSLTYLRACIDEALRLNAPVPSYLLRDVLPGGISVGDDYFSHGITLGTSAYAIHHNSDYFPDPFTFIPERWIADDGDDGHNRVMRARSAFFAFSAGSRGCVGKNLAYLELLIALGTLLFTFDMRLPVGLKERQPSGEGSPDSKHIGRRRTNEYQFVDQFLPRREGPMVQFRKRII